MDPAYRFPTSPGTPLFPVSPERINRQQVQNSPPLPTGFPYLQNDPFGSQRNSMVQGKVAQFNEIAQKARRRDNEAALERAILGREEAENETRRLREENRVLRQETEEGRARERKVGQRLETVIASWLLVHVLFWLMG
jgi:carbamoylphosphate synthase large subunit